MGRPRTAPEVRFWRRVEVADCWEWTGSCDRHGYGQFYDGVRNTRAHRYAYKTLVGPIPRGLVIDHLCRNTICVNPDHMQVVTVRENTLRGNTFQARNLRKTHCPQGHPYDQANTYLHRGKRHCRICQRDANRRYYERQAA
jgi:hypothetical protein